MVLNRHHAATNGLSAYPPLLGALLGDLGDLDVLGWILLLVLFVAHLHEEAIRRGLSSHVRSLAVPA